MPTKYTTPSGTCTLTLEELERMKRGRERLAPAAGACLLLGAVRSHSWPWREPVHAAGRFARAIRGTATLGRGRVSRPRSNRIAKRSRTWLPRTERCHGCGDGSIRSRRSGVAGNAIRAPVRSSARMRRCTCWDTDTRHATEKRGDAVMFMEKAISGGRRGCEWRGTASTRSRRWTRRSVVRVPHPETAGCGLGGVDHANEGTRHGGRRISWSSADCAAPSASDSDRRRWTPPDGEKASAARRTRRSLAARRSRPVTIQWRLKTMMTFKSKTDQGGELSLACRGLGTGQVGDVWVVSAGLQMPPALEQNSER